MRRPRKLIVQALEFRCFDHRVFIVRMKTSQVRARIPKGDSFPSKRNAEERLIEHFTMPFSVACCSPVQVVEPGKIQLPGGFCFLPLDDNIHVKSPPALPDANIAVQIIECSDAASAEALQQRFVDEASRNDAKPTSIHDVRGDWMEVTRAVVEHVSIFAGHVDLERTALSNRSRNLFTLSAIHQANVMLLAEVKDESQTNRIERAVEYWSLVSRYMPEWIRAKAGTIAAADYRKTFICAHGIAIAALARVGRQLILRSKQQRKRVLAKLKTIDWTRENSALWEGRAMIGGRVSKASMCVILTANAIKQHIGIELTSHETEVEAGFRKRA